MLKKSRAIAADLFAFLALERKRFFYKWNLVAWLIILVLLFLAVNHRANEIIALPKKQQKFKEIQKKYFQKTRTYEIYSVYGIKVLFTPAAAVIFSGCNAVPRDLTLKFDSIVMLQIFNNYKGKSLARGMFQGRRGFAGIVLNLVTILALWYGFTSMQTREYLKFLCQIRSKRRIFWSVVVSRFILFSAAFLLINGILYAYVRTRGIAFTAGDHAGLLGNLAAALVMLGVFFAVGVLFGSRGASALSYILLFISWYVLVSAVPGALGSWAEKNFPGTIEDYQTELENFETLVEFEGYCEKIAGSFNRSQIDIERKFAEEYRDIYVKSIHAREGELKSRIESNIDTLGMLSILCPTTFYMNTSNEVSSRGYLNFIDFYQYGREMKQKFVRFYIDRTFYNDPKVLVSFIKGSEDIFVGRSRLPNYFVHAILLNLFYAAAILFFSYLRFKQWLFPSPKKTVQFNHINIPIAKNKIITFSVDRLEFVHQLVNVFFGQSKKPGLKITLEGKDITAGLKGGFAYLFNPRHLPGELKPVYLLLLFKRLFNLTNEEIEKIKDACGRKIMDKLFSAIEKVDKARFLLALVEVRTPGIIIFNDFTGGIPGNSRNELAERVENLKEGGALIFDIVSGEYYWLEPDTRVTAAFDDGIYKVLTN
jgi:hypothetical protein